jgi:hypothetical protein
MFIHHRQKISYGLCKKRLKKYVNSNFVVLKIAFFYTGIKYIVFLRNSVSENKCLDVPIFFGIFRNFKN